MDRVSKKCKSRIKLLRSNCTSFRPRKSLTERQNSPEVSQNQMSSSLYNVIWKSQMNLEENFSKSSPVFGKAIVGGVDIGSLMKDNAEGKFWRKRRRVLESWHFPQKEKVKTTLMLFHLILRLVWKTLVALARSPMKCFNNVVQSLRNFRSEEENPLSSVVDENLNFLANSFYGYNIMDRRPHTVTIYLEVDKTRGASNYRIFKVWGHGSDQIYETELVKSEVKHS